jgi:hypothetical protein
VGVEQQEVDHGRNERTTRFKSIQQPRGVAQVDE